MNIRHFVRGWMVRGLVLVALLCGVVSSQAVVLVVTNGPFRCSYYNAGDDDGTSTGSVDWSTLQMDDVKDCINTWDSKIENTPGRLVELHLFWRDLAPGVLGSSYNPIIGDYSTAWTRTEYVWREGQNYTAGTDARIVYDADAAGYTWNFGTNAPGATQIDFRSVITHEIGHCLGFVTTYSSASDTFWSGGLTEFSKYLIDDAGNRPAAGSSGTPGNFNQLDNPVYFTGPYAVAANGGTNVEVYAPTTWSSGSSLSHVNQAKYDGALMNPFISLGHVARDANAVEYGMLQDIGWQVIPEPATAMLLLGAAVAAVVRNRRKRMAGPN